MDRLEVNQPVFRRQVESVGQLVTAVDEIRRTENQGTLSAAYSSVSGLDQLGEYHGAVVDGGVGSAVATLQKYAQQVSWLRDGLVATEKALTSQEGLTDRAMQIADAGGHVGEELTLFPARPDQNFEDFSFPSPVVTIPSSLSELSAAFSATDSSAVAATSDSWRAMAQNAKSLAQDLRLTAWDMDEVNKAYAISAAVKRALEIADAADTFAENAQAMAGSVDAMGAVEQASASHVAMAELAIAFIQDPVEKEAAEQAFLQSFMGATFPAAVESVMPPIRNLMSLERAGEGGGSVRAGLEDIAGNGGTPVVDQISAGTAAFQQLIDDPRNISAGNFGNISQTATQLAGVGAPTTPAGTVAHAPVSPSIGGVGSFTPPNLLGSAGGSGVPNPMTVPPFAATLPGSNGVSVSGTRPSGTTGLGSGNNRQQLGGTTPSAFMPAGQLDPALGRAQMSNSGGKHRQRGNGQSGAGTGSLAGGFGASGAAAGIGAGAGALGAMGGIGAMGAGHAGAVQPQLATTAGASTSASAARSAMPFGGMPMGAAQGEQKKTKVKTVTSALEEEGNLKALLGDLPPVLPGAIGSWARG